MSDTTITRCQSCGQEMHPTDYVQRLRDDIASYKAAMPVRPTPLRPLSDGEMVENNGSKQSYFSEYDYDALAKSHARLTVDVSELTRMNAELTKCVEDHAASIFGRENKRLTAELEAARKVVKFADELCVAVDKAAEDIGGSRPTLDILRDLGPAVDAALSVGI